MRPGSGGGRGVRGDGMPKSRGDAAKSEPVPLCQAPLHQHSSNSMMSPAALNCRVQASPDMVAARSHMPLHYTPAWWQAMKWRTATLSAVLLAIIGAAGIWSPRESAAPLYAAANLGSEAEHGSSGCPALPWVPRGCQHLRHACLDQGQAVLYGQEYQPSQASATNLLHRLPSWNPRAADNYPFLTDGGSNPDYLTVPGLPPPKPPLAFRPVSGAEPAPDLASPQVRMQLVSAVEQRQPEARSACATLRLACTMPHLLSPSTSVSRLQPPMACSGPARCR